MDLKKLNYKVEGDSTVQYIFIATNASPDSVDLSKQLHKSASDAQYSPHVTKVVS